jgi:hypothetical protein
MSRKPKLAKSREFHFRGWIHREDNPEFDNVKNVYDIENLAKIKSLMICISAEDENAVRNFLSAYSDLSLPMKRVRGDLMVKVGISNNGRGNIRDRLDPEIMRNLRIPGAGWSAKLIGLELVLAVDARKYAFKAETKSIAGVRFILTSLSMYHRE